VAACLCHLCVSGALTSKFAAIFIRESYDLDLRNFNVYGSGNRKSIPIYRVSIKSFPDYKHLLQENYVKYKLVDVLKCTNVL